MTTLPTIHLNGTGLQSLRDEYASARKAIIAAQDALAYATCHPRDFYPQSNEAFYQAREEREQAMQSLREALSYVESWEDHLWNSGRST